MDRRPRWARVSEEDPRGRGERSPARRQALGREGGRGGPARVWRLLCFISHPTPLLTGVELGPRVRGWCRSSPAAASSGLRSSASTEPVIFCSWSPAPRFLPDQRPNWSLPNPASRWEPKAPLRHGSRRIPGAAGWGRRLAEETDEDTEGRLARGPGGGVRFCAPGRPVGALREAEVPPPAATRPPVLARADRVVGTLRLNGSLGAPRNRTPSPHVS